MNCLCIKNWHMNKELIFKEKWRYPILEKCIDGDKKVIGYKIQIEDDFGIWFWSESEYFEVPKFK